MLSYQEYLDEQRKRFEELRASVHLMLLAIPDLLEVGISYDGSGDDGQVDEESLWTTPDLDLPDEVVKKLVDLAYAAVDAIEPGWQNAEGAFGNVVWTREEGEIKVEHNVRTYSYEEYTL
jgi:hypothetical protein